MEPTARTLITGGITITKRARFFLSYPLKPVLVQNLQGAGGHRALRITKKKGKKTLVPTCTSSSDTSVVTGHPSDPEQTFGGLCLSPHVYKIRT